MFLGMSIPEFLTAASDAIVEARRLAAEGTPTPLEGVEALS